MAARSIVEGIDLIGHVGDGIVPAVAFPAHTRLKAIRPAETSPGVAAKLGTLIRVNQRAARSSAAHGRQHRIEHQLAVNGRLGGPPDDPARE